MRRGREIKGQWSNLYSLTLAMFTSHQSLVYVQYVWCVCSFLLIEFLWFLSHPSLLMSDVFSSFFIISTSLSPLVLISSNLFGQQNGSSSRCTFSFLDPESHAESSLNGNARNDVAVKHSKAWEIHSTLSSSEILSRCKFPTIRISHHPTFVLFSSYHSDGIHGDPWSLQEFPIRMHLMTIRLLDFQHHHLIFFFFSHPFICPGFPSLSRLLLSFWISYFLIFPMFRDQEFRLADWNTSLVSSLSPVFWRTDFEGRELDGKTS